MPAIRGPVSASLPDTPGSPYPGRIFMLACAGTVTPYLAPVVARAEPTFAVSWLRFVAQHFLLVLPVVNRITKSVRRAAARPTFARP